MSTRRPGRQPDPRTPEKKFWDLVTKSEGCWGWTGPLHQQGYGFLCINSSRLLAHRFSYELHNGPIPNGLHIDHRCMTKACTRPDHLRLATNKQNHENITAARPDSKTGVRGVYQTRGGRWWGRVTHHGKRYSAGTHDTIEEAEAAVIALRLELFTHNDADRRAA